ncbi:tRNA(Ile)-lysidine synthase [Thermomonospora echinospora]|uniref:tRNA(Ile)-lysidine synthase n=1 Tax=Thermomonospora echinospora TaxID=1992 RepID=A0A1H5YVG0_9ACTN|nr:tRNA lysidine(34) synthetase TilS [Thermomonospora echinospora]SEG27732.1 tRNA(Ile)-lysidine synthase [Thermomonospora echinospora]
MGPDPAVATVRVAVRRALNDLPAGARVLVACSGGADSLALAAAVAFEAPRAGREAGGVTVDHGLQEGSARVADAVVRTMRDLGLDPAGSVAVTVGAHGGPENAARHARYTALDEAAGRLGAVVFLGHTLDDQAETVLLGLARGSGARSLAGMPPDFRRGEIRYVRPILALDRATTRRACLAMDLEPWDDPHNEDPAYTRVRLRHEALPALEKALGPGVAAALARTARLLRDDAEALDALAARAYADVLDGEGGGLDVAALEALPRAVRTRVLRRAAIEAGGPAGTLAAVHVDELDRLVTAWRGQHHVDLPGGVRALRRYGKLLFRRRGTAADGRRQ